VRFEIESRKGKQLKWLNILCVYSVTTKVNISRTDELIRQTLNKHCLKHAYLTLRSTKNILYLTLLMYTSHFHIKINLRAIYVYKRQFLT